MPTTFRQDIVAGLVTILDGFKTANPTLLRHTFSARPPGFNTDLPCAFVGPRPETATHSQGIRTRTLSGLSVSFVDRLTDNAETMTRMDVLVDAFADYLTARPHVIPGTIWNTWTVIDEQLDIGDGRALQVVTFTLPDLSISEGRV